MANAPQADLAVAAATWNDPDESLESVNARIHDGVPLEKLQERAQAYVGGMFGGFPYMRLASRPVCMEIGSGTGYIMEAVERELTRRLNPPATVIGLDIAENMLAKAKQRLAGRGPFQFLHYDGVTVPLPDESLDLIYSVATLQHVPKPYVYHLFFEMKRLLKPGGFAAISLLSFKDFAEHVRTLPWHAEIRQQIGLQPGHWHHYYCREEVENVLKVGTGFRFVDVRDEGGLWACMHKSPVALPRDFDGERYIALNPDVSGTDPASHWVEFGYREGRRWK